jgi:hypothetical protein
LRETWRLTAGAGRKRRRQVATVGGVVYLVAGCLGRPYLQRCCSRPSGVDAVLRLCDTKDIRSCLALAPEWEQRIITDPAG